MDPLPLETSFTYTQVKFKIGLTVPDFLTPVFSVLQFHI